MLKKYAQEIADSTAEAIGYPVFITDMNGIIIGCSDPNRGLGTLHEASLRAIKTKCGYLEDEEEAKKFRGTKQGATYPIEESSGNIVGTVAITGDPAKVAPFALVVKKQAEILLREKVLSEMVLNQERTLQNLVQEIANYDAQTDNDTLIADKAKYFGYDRQLPYMVIAVELTGIKHVNSQDFLGNESSSEITIQAMKTKAFYHIRSIFNKPQDICSPISNYKYVIMRALYNNMQHDDQLIRETIHMQCLQVIQTLFADGFHANTGVGSIARGIEGLADSYREARDAILIGKSLNDRHGVYHIQDYRVEELLLSANRQRLNKHLKIHLENLKNQSDWPELRDTVSAWCESQFNMARAAKKLHIHRNTLDYRLDKIEKIIRIDPRNFRQILKLYTAIQMDLIWSTIAIPESD